MSDYDVRMAKHLMRQDQEAASNRSSFQGDASRLGPPHWDRDAWEAYKAQYGYYPFGNQNGSRVLPPSFEGCPDWAYAAMGLRPTPVTVMGMPT